VERAIANLRQADLLEPKALYATPLEELEELIRPAGYYRIKARRLRNLLELVVKRYGGSLEKMFASDPAALREQLLAVKGIGPETADSILLYAGGIPVFVIDAYTYRIFARHGWVEPDADYHRLQEYFHSQLADDAAMFNEYHALLVRLGKHYCHKRRPRCPGCPLEELLPSGGPAEVG